MIFEALFGMSKKDTGYALEDLTPERLCALFEGAYLDARPADSDDGEVVVECDGANVVVRPRPELEIVSFFALFPQPIEDRSEALELCNEVNVSLPLLRAGLLSRDETDEGQIVAVSHDHAVGDKVITPRELVRVLHAFSRMLLLWHVQAARRQGA